MTGAVPVVKDAAAMQAVARTAYLVATTRHLEAKEKKPLFHDPYAEALAGDVGPVVEGKFREALQPYLPHIALRTWWLDNKIIEATRAGISQCVIPGAGLDSRAFRLKWPGTHTLYEVDQPPVLNYKDATMKGLGVTLPKWRTVVPVKDLAIQWMPDLLRSGFNNKAPTVWVVEGLLYYLDDVAIQQLFHLIDANSAPGSKILFDVFGKSILTSPMLQNTNALMAKGGAPWVSATDNPAGLVPPGWRTSVEEGGKIGWPMNRWPFEPGTVPDEPRTFMVEATKLPRVRK